MNIFGKKPTMDWALVKKLSPEFQEATFIGGAAATPASTIHAITGNISRYVADDLVLLRAGRVGLKSDYVRNFLLARDIDPDSLPSLSDRRRSALHDDVVRTLRQVASSRAAEQNLDSVAECLLGGKDADSVLWEDVGSRHRISTTVGALRAALGQSVEDFLRLDPRAQARAMRHASRRLRETGKDEAYIQSMVQARTTMHHGLREWDAGELVLERPQSSSLHHLMDYDVETTRSGTFADELEDVQCVVVENDWGASVPPIAGEWRPPYPVMCWEFRISGVRVLAFTDESDVRAGTSGGMTMWIVYGRHGHWVIDDYSYEVGHPRLPVGIPHRKRNTSDGVVFRSRRDVDLELRRAASRVYACIRGICIMREARVVHQVARTTDRSAVSKKADVGRTKSPPRDYYVVQLVHAERRAYHQRKIVAGRVTESRAPQRGHWRAGTWVHFDDQDSGREQYVNDGGFVVSRTWRPWHFAGDPNNIIHKEYRA